MNTIYAITENVNEITDSRIDESDRIERETLIEDIQCRGVNPVGYNLHNLSIIELEALLDYGDPRAYSQTQYSQDRNYLTGRHGRSFMPCETMPEEYVRKWNDVSTMKYIRGHAASTRIIHDLHEFDIRESKQDKIEYILDCVDDKYRAIIAYIRHHDMEKLIDLTINRYESTIRKYIAALLRIRGKEMGISISIDDACDALGTDSTKYLAIAHELQQADLYDQSKLLHSIEDIVNAGRNALYDMQRKDMISYTTTQNALSILEPAAQHLRISLNKIQDDKIGPFITIVLNRYIEITPSVIRSFIGSDLIVSENHAASVYHKYNRLSNKYNQFFSMDFTSSIEDLRTSDHQVDNHSQSTKLKNVDHQDISESSSSEAIVHVQIQSGSEHLDYVIGSDDPTFIIDDLIDHINNNEPFNHSMYYGSSNPNQNISKLDINSTLRLKGDNMRNENNTMIMGMIGELTRSILKTSADGSMSWISTRSKQEIINSARHLRTNRYRLAPQFIPEFNHIKINPIFQELIQCIENTDGPIIIDDLRWIINDNAVLQSNLDLSIKDAVEAKLKQLLKTRSSTLLKSRLNEILREYKSQYINDISRVNTPDPPSLVELQIHNPNLRSPAKHKIRKWIDDPKIITTASLSAGIVTSPEGISYNHQWTVPEASIRDQLLLEISSPVCIVSADPNDIGTIIYRTVNHIEVTN